MRKMQSIRNTNIHRTKVKRESEKAKKELREIDREAELDYAKDKSEFLKSRENVYRKNERDAYSKEYREFWRDKRRSVYEAESNYIRLKNKSGN